MWQYRHEVYLENGKDAPEASDESIINLSLIWRLIVEFNRLESTIEWSFCELISHSDDELWVMIMWTMTYEKKCGLRYTYLARRLWLVKTKKSFNFLEKLMQINKSLKDIWEFRNHVVHWFWHEQDSEGFVRARKSSFTKKWVEIKYLKIYNIDIKEHITIIRKIIPKIDGISSTVQNTY